MKQSKGTIIFLVILIACLQFFRMGNTPVEFPEGDSAKNTIALQGSYKAERQSTEIRIDGEAAGELAEDKEEAGVFRISLNAYGISCSELAAKSGDQPAEFVIAPVPSEEMKAYEIRNAAGTVVRTVREESFTRPDGTVTPELFFYDENGTVSEYLYDEKTGAMAAYDGKALVMNSEVSKSILSDRFLLILHCHDDGAVETLDKLFMYVMTIRKIRS